MAMLRVTTFKWEVKDVLKGELQMIKAIAPILLCRHHTKQLLATAEGWALWQELKSLIQDAGHIKT